MSPNHLRFCYPVQIRLYLVEIRPGPQTPGRWAYIHLTEDGPPTLLDDHQAGVV